MDTNDAKATKPVCETDFCTSEDVERIAIDLRWDRGDTVTTTGNTYLTCSEHRGAMFLEKTAYLARSLAERKGWVKKERKPDQAKRDERVGAQVAAMGPALDAQAETSA